MNLRGGNIVFRPLTKTTFHLASLPCHLAAFKLGSGLGSVYIETEIGLKFYTREIVLLKPADVNIHVYEKCRAKRDNQSLWKFVINYVTVDKLKSK